MAKFQSPILRYAEIVAMSWLKVSPNPFQLLDECSKARSSAQAHFLEIVEGRSYIWILKKRRAKNRFLEDAVSQTSKPASRAITGGEGEASISNKLQDHLNHMLIRRSLSSLQVRQVECLIPLLPAS